MAIPVFNEEESMPRLIEVLMKTMNGLGEDYEVIIVDDGSVDNTLHVLDKLCSDNDNIRIIKLSRHYGKEAALYAAFKAARGQVVVTMDGDLQNLPEDIPLLLGKIGQCDAAIGWRKRRHDPLIKRISSYIANLAKNMVLGENFHDAGCALRAFKRECLMDAIEYKMCDLFLISIMRSKGCKIEEVVVGHAFRKFGKSKFNIRNRLFKNTVALFRARTITRKYKKCQPVPKMADACCCE